MSDREFIEHLEPLDQDIYHLLNDLGKSQRDVGQILNLTQPSICYRWKKAKEKIDILKLLPNVSESDILLTKSLVGFSDKESLILDVKGFESY